MGCRQESLHAAQVVALAPDAVAPDAVQAVSCLVEALHQFSLQGSAFLYEASVAAMLGVLLRLSQSPAYLAILTGGPALTMH
jgi:hypothetical protein